MHLHTQKTAVEGKNYSALQGYDRYDFPFLHYRQIRDYCYFATQLEGMRVQEAEDLSLHYSHYLQLYVPVQVEAEH